MTGDIDYYEWLAEGWRIRVGVRAIIFGRARDRILVERAARAQE